MLLTKWWWLLLLLEQRTKPLGILGKRHNILIILHCITYEKTHWPSFWAWQVPYRQQGKLFLPLHLKKQSFCKKKQKVWLKGKEIIRLFVFPVAKQYLKKCAFLLYSHIQNKWTSNLALEEESNRRVVTGRCGCLGH